MKYQKLAAIDIGTNTFRLLIGEVHTDFHQKNFSIKEIYSERIITRLGEGISDNGLINRQAITRSINTLKNFSNVISSRDVYKTSAVATSALRDADNSSNFIKKAKEETGLEIKVITGKQEAELTATGMLLDMPISKPALMADIGGGSTELIFYSGKKQLLVNSINLGVVYLAGRYMLNDPPRHEELKQMEEEIIHELASAIEPFKKLFSKDTVLVGTAGTITALAAMAQDLKKFEHDKIHKFILTLDKVKSIFSTISVLSSDDRARFIPFELARLDIIVPGTLILLKLMKSSGFKEITVSNYGLLEGILIDLYKKER